MTRIEADVTTRTTLLNQDVALPVIVIPAYQPHSSLLHLVDSLSTDPRQVIIVVDDGSSSTHAHVFDALRRTPGVHVLRHAVNLGKGQALKTAFNYFLVALPERHVGVVTADADGQHLPQDVQLVSRALAHAPHALVLGTRQLRGDIPWKSAVGNRLTKHIFHRLLGRKVEDTQTGLRGIPRSFLPELLRISATRYEFELEMLVKAIEQRLDIQEVPIETVYEDDNRGSHFNPVFDSLRIYFVFLRFALLSLATAALDLSVFAAAYAASSNILLSTVSARIVAVVFNYHVARTAVFKSKGRLTREFLKYVALVVWLMLLSYTILTGLVIFLGLNVFLSKIIAETTLFLASFTIQRMLVFSRQDQPHQGSDRTDWDAYYTRPPRQAQATRQITTRLLLRLMREHAVADVRSICEFGGANSCFYEAMRQAFPDAEYMVLDNNTLGLELLRNRWPHDDLLSVRNENILVMPDGLVQADIVYSVGLIEHFSPVDTAAVIEKHFACVRPGGLVIITFPTPTWLYRTIRCAAEQLGMWHFPDERPLSFEEVETQIRKRADIVDSRINWPILLTQGIVVARVK